MKKIFSITSLFLLSFSSVLAYNPFDIITQNDPELSIVDIYQEYSTLNINLKVCNNGGSIDNGTLSLAIEKSSGTKKRKTIEINNFDLAGGACENYFVAKPQDLGITVKGNYYLKGGVVLNYSRPEQNTFNNIISKNISINVLTPGNTYNNNNYYNNYNQSYYCNGTWYNSSSYSNGYYCNGIWYNFNNNSYNNYNNSYVEYYSCNGIKYSYNSSDSGYYCNGTWYYRNSSTNTSNQSYYCNGGRYTSSYTSGYYCNGTWYNFNNYNNSYNSNYYYCNGSRYNYSTNDYGYYCNGNWYSRNNNNNNNNQSYYCNGTWYNSSNYSNGYYCNGTWYNFNSNYGVDFYIKNISYNRDTRKINSDICLNYGSNSINEYIELEFRGNGINRTVGKRVNLSPGYCTTGEFSIYTEDLNLWENNSYNIEVVVKNSGNYSDSNTSNNNKYERFYIDNY